MMHYIRVTLVLSLTVIFVRSQQLMAYREHEIRLRQYPCGIPQPRVFDVEHIADLEELKVKTNGNLRLIQPAVTVLHRCESTGCCRSPAEKCHPWETEDVTLTFLISGSRLNYLEVPAVNHTLCGCTKV